MLIQHELPMFSDIAWPYHKDYCPQYSDLNIRFEVTHKKRLSGVTERTLSKMKMQ